MSTALIDFLVEVGNDAHKKSVFQHDPESILNSTNLSAEEITLLLNRDVDGLKNHFDREKFSTTWVHVFS